MRLAPGGPFDGERRLPPEIEANLLAAYNLDKPIIQQYFDYLVMLSRGDLGPSFKQKDFTVNELVAAGLPVSLTVGGFALLIALATGISLGVCAGLVPARCLSLPLFSAMRDEDVCRVVDSLGRVLKGAQ